jgi:hypothetical protein
MPGGNENLIRLLEAELDFVEGGGYGQPAGHPKDEKPMFFHSPVCINSWCVPDHSAECHEDCVLLEVVPEKHRVQNLPCHFIPLNAMGETIKSIEESGDRERLEEAVKDWLRRTIQRLKEGENVLGISDVKY